MCAGITVWGALAEYGLKATDSVGVVGVGGLGHLALQFASKMGCEVVAFSGTESKKEEALSLGATHFVATKGVKELVVPRKIDHLIVTTSFMPDWNQFGSVMNPLATIVPLSIVDGDAKLIMPYMQFVLSGWKVVGSTVPAKVEYSKMLAFAGQHGIKPIIEAYPLTKKGVEESLKKLDTEGMRYRAVLYADKA